MDVREKLEVIAHLGDHISYKEDIGICYDSDLAKVVEDAYMELKNGVTVQDGKPLEAFLHPIDAYKGLKAKYLVFKADTGEKVENCFILRPDKDAAAVEALRAYARTTDNETLAEDIYNWVGKGGPVQEWISVKDKLPKVGEDVLVTVFDGYDTWVDMDCLMRDGKWCGETENRHISHWRPMPQPPKGE